MKTHYLFLTLAATLLLGSCAKEVTSDNSSSAKPEENGQMTIRATLADGQDTKTVLNGDGSVFWQPGDQIAVFFNSVKVPFTAYNNVNAASALFVGNTFITTGHNENSNGEVAGDYSYWGLYPYCNFTLRDLDLYSSYSLYKEHVFSYYHQNPIYYWRFLNEEYDYLGYDEEGFKERLISPATCDGNTISTRLFHWQQGVPNTFDRYLNIAVAKSNDYKELSFYNVLGGVRFTVNADNITRVTFRGNNGESLAGDLVIGMNAEGRPEVKEFLHPEKTITVSLAGDKPFQPGVWYYALMAPTQLTQGYTMELYTATAKAVKTVSSPVEVKRSVFGSLSEIDNGLSFSEPVVYPRALNSYTVGPYTPINPDEWIYWTFSSSSNTIFLREGYQLKITANPTPINCTFPAKYESYRPEIASISEEGILTAIRPGETEIYCLVDDQEYVLHVKVFSFNSCFSLSVRPAESEYGKSSIYVGETLSLVAIPDPADCPTAPVWTSSDENVATVNSEGVVTGIAPGSVTITADIAGTSGSYSVSVLSSDQARRVEIQYPEDVDLHDLYPGVQIQMTAVIDPETYTGPVTWTSENTSVAVVDEKGLVTCVGEGGTEIRVTVQGANGEESAREWISVEPFILDALNYYKDGQEVSLEGYLVYASNLTGFVIGDDDEYTYRRTFAHVYQGDSPAVAVRPGDIVNVKGLKSTFHGGVEISGEGLSVEVLSSGNDIPEIDYYSIYKGSDDWKKVRPIRAEGYLRRMSSTMYILYEELWTPTPWIYLGHNDTTPAAYVYEKVEVKGFSLFPATDGNDIIDLENMMISEINSDNYHAPTSVKDVLENGFNGETYRVKGTVSSIANTNYGNFYIKDDSTETALYIYGTKDWEGKDPKDIEGGWNSYGIVVGSEVEVYGERTTYGSTIELTNVRIVSVKN